MTPKHVVADEQTALECWQGQSVLALALLHLFITHLWCVSTLLSEAALYSGFASHALNSCGLCYADV